MKRSMTHPDDGKFWLMLIDNDPDLIELTRVAAKIEGILFCAHETPGSAFQMLKQAHYKMSAIVVDLKVSPDMDGIGLTAQLIRNQSLRKIPDEDRIPIFWYTGWPIDEEMQRISRKYHVVKIFQKGTYTPLSMIREIEMTINLYGAPKTSEE